MKNTHRTADGQTMFISQMETSHLENTIKMHLKNIKECMDMVANVNITNNIDLLLAGVDNESVKERAKELLKRSHAELGKYLIEAYIRGIDLSKEFQETFGRKEASIDIGVFKKAITQKYLSGDEYVFGLDLDE